MRTKLKKGGKRPKAFFGADGAVMAAATLAAAGMTTAATINAAKSQSKAITDSAAIQATSIKDQTTNNNNLQRESIEFTRQQNRENRQQQQDIQTTLQVLAGQQNMNDIMESNKVQVKYGGKPKRRKLKSIPFYGGANDKFKVTDGGGVIPIDVTPDGYGLYELYGNDHEHYHKAPGGKNKTGVGIKFNDGSVVEGEGNQNSNQGELMYITPDDAVFISKHSINGFNPTEAVKNGVHPIQAFNIQETIKAQKGLNDDGSRRRRNLGGFNVLNNYANITQLPSNGTAGVASGIAYAIPNIDETSSPVAKCGKRISIKRCGGRKKANLGTNIPGYNYTINRFGNIGINNNTTTNKKGLFNGDYAGAAYNAVGNFLGSGITAFGNIYASNKLGKAYIQAGNILEDAYSQMKGIDLSEINREDYAAPHTMAVIRYADTNINPQLERIRRNAAYETREINRNTLSSAARQQRLAATNDRMFQRSGELYAYKHNEDEKIHQGNVERITQTANENANRDVQARRNYITDRLNLMMHNNSIANSRLAGMAQARADALTQSSMTRSQGLQSGLSSIGTGIANSAQGFASTNNGLRTERINRENVLIGADTSNKIDYLISNPTTPGNRQQAYNLWLTYKNGNEKAKEYARRINQIYNFA